MSVQRDANNSAVVEAGSEEGMSGLSFSLVEKSVQRGVRLEHGDGIGLKLRGDDERGG
jgi:hypothetical protein